MDIYYDNSILRSYKVSKKYSVLIVIGKVLQSKYSGDKILVPLSLLVFSLDFFHDMKWLLERDIRENVRKFSYKNNGK